MAWLWAAGGGKRPFIKKSIEILDTADIRVNADAFTLRSARRQGLKPCQRSIFQCSF